MKKSIKQLFMLIGMLVALLLIWTVSSLFGRGRRIIGGETRVLHETSESIQGIENIRIDLGSEGVKVEFADTQEVVVKHSSNRDIGNGREVMVKRNQNTLVISRARNFSFSFSFMNFEFGDWQTQREYIEVVIPRSYANDYLLDMSSGSIEVEGILLGRDIGIDLSSGKIDIPNIEAERIKIETTSGAVFLGEVTAEKTFVDLSSGKVRIQELKSEEISIDVMSGDVQIDNKQMPNVIKIDTSSGSVKLSLPENEGFQIAYDMTSGSLTNEFTGNRLSREGVETYKNVEGPVYEVEVMSGSVKFLKSE